MCIDDASRIALSQIYPEQKKESSVGFLKAAVAYYPSPWVTVTSVMTDYGLKAERNEASPQSFSVRQHALAA